MFVILRIVSWFEAHIFNGVSQREPVRRVLFPLLYSDKSVEEAGAILRVTAQREPRAARKMARYLAAAQHRENSYEVDRGAQILAAAMGKPWRSRLTEQEKETFRREHALGSESLRDAFEILVELAPELGRLRDEIVAEGEASDERASLRRWERGKRLSTLVGPGANDPDPLVRSSVAIMIASMYLGVIAGTEPAENLEKHLYGRRLNISSGAPRTMPED